MVITKQHKSSIKKTAYSMPSQKTESEQSENSKKRRSVRFKIDGEDTPRRESARKHLFSSRSKSRDGEGTVPATIKPPILRSNNSRPDDSGVIKVFKQDSKQPQTSLPLRKYDDMHYNINNNSQKASNKKARAANAIFSHNNQIPEKASERIIEVDSDSDNSSLSQEEKHFEAMAPNLQSTKRRRFLDKCYEIQERYLEMIEKNMKKSEKKNPNRELIELAHTIKSINKADLYERILKDNIDERNWIVFLNKVYSQPNQWTS